jgi:hypothetical protein
MESIPQRASLRLAKVKADTVSGVATALLKVPGTPGVDKGRLIQGGTAWFGIPTLSDQIEVHISDEDNILGQGAGTIIASYTDSDVPEANKGWFIPKSDLGIQVTAFAELAAIPAGFYLKIVGKKGDLNLSDTLFVNIKWGIE